MDLDTKKTRINLFYKNEKNTSSQPDADRSQFLIIVLMNILKKFDETQSCYDVFWTNSTFIKKKTECMTKWRHSNTYKL